MPERTTEIRSEEVQEILSRIPNWTVRWGITLIFVLLLMAFFLACLIRYPDTIQGQVTLTTQTPPVKLVSQTSGKLEHICVADNTWVEAGTLIARVSNPVSEQALTYLQGFLVEVQESLAKPPSSVQAASDNCKHGFVFGQVQGEYNNLKRLYQDYITLVKNDQYQEKVKVLKVRITSHKQITSITTQQILYVEKDLMNAKNKYEAYEQLYTKGGIAKLVLMEKEKEYLVLQQVLEEKKKNLIQNKMTVAEYEAQLRELTFEHAEDTRLLKASIHASLQNIENYIHQWQQEYTLKAPLAGTLSYLHIFSKAHFVRSGEELFMLVPQEEYHIACAQVPSQGYGKVKIGQKVKIRLDPYPYQEYGYLPAKVKDITRIPTQAQYRVILRLESSLRTTYGKVLPFKPAMEGWAEIITEDVSLLQRIANKVLGIYKQ